MVRIVAVDSCHIIDIVIFHRVDELLHHWLVELEAGEILGRILIRDGFSVAELVEEVPSALDELAHLDVMVRGG